MGSGGKGDVLPLVCYIISFILCLVAVCLTISDYEVMMVANCLYCAAGSYIIILLLFITWSAASEEIDKVYAAWIMAVGAVFNIIAGLTVTIYFGVNHGYDNQIVGGVLPIVAGVLMIVDVLATLGKI